MDCACDSPNVKEDIEFTQLGYSSSILTLKIDFALKLGLKNLDEVGVYPCVFTGKIGPTTDDGCPLANITISKGEEIF